MEDKIHLLYQQILCATKNGHDAEVRRDKDGNFVVYSVKNQLNWQLVRAKGSRYRSIFE